MIRKKAQWGTYITLFIAATLTFFLFTQGEAVAQFINKEKYTNICKLSIEKAHYSKLSGTLPKGFAGNALDCPRRYVTFYEDKILAEVAEDKLPLKPEYKTISQEEVRRGIAEEIVNCWEMMGQGKYNPFDVGVLEDQQSACIICSIIDFDEDAIKKLNSKLISNFDENYFKNNKLLGTKKTYYDSLKSPSYSLERDSFFYFKLKKEGEKFALDSSGEIDTTKKHYIIYIGYRPSAIKFYFTEDFKSVLNWMGFETERTKDPLGLLFLIKEEDLDTLNCEFLYN